MNWSEILNLIFGTGLLATIIGLLSIRSKLRQAVAEADKAMADADTVKITNTEQATRILIQNIVEPLKRELNETRKELNALKREVARFRKAVDSANSCRYSDDCPVLERMRDAQDNHDGQQRRARGNLRGRQYGSGSHPRQSGNHVPAKETGAGEGASEQSEAIDSPG